MLIKISDENPWVVLIHGLGVTEKVWFSPLEEKSSFISYKILLKDEKEIIPFAERCNRHSYNIACWTQNINSTIDEAAVELKNLTESIDSRDIAFIAHSRGGLVARRAIQKFGLNPKVLICLSTPHFGSRFADLAMKHGKLIKPVLKAMDDLMIPIAELHTGSSIIKDINSTYKLELERHVPHFDICGDTTTYFRIGFFCVMRSIETLFKDRLINEWRDSYGDGFVSIESAKSLLTNRDNYFKLPVNHINILINSDAFGIVNKILGDAFRHSS